MPVEAYQIGISFVSDASKVTGPLDRIIQLLVKVQEAQRATQMGFNEMTSSLRGADRTANSLALTMERVARAANAAAAASGKIRNAGGGAAGGGSDGSPPPRQAPAAAPLPPMLFLPPGGGSTPADRAVAIATGAPAALPASQAAGLVPYGGAGGGLVPSAGALVPSPGGGGSSMPPLRPGTIPGGPGGGGPGAPGGGGGIRFPRLPLPALGPYGKMLGGYVGYETLKHSYDEGADYGDITEKMRAMYTRQPDGSSGRAFTEDQIKQAQTQAMATMRRVPGLGLNQAMDVILQTAGLLGSSSKALQLAPQLSFDAQVLSRFGKGDAIGQIEAALQAGELTGLTNKDGTLAVPKLLDFVNRITRTTVAMGGQLDVPKYLTGVRQFGLGAEAADMDFTTAVLPAYMKIMGNAKAGTALTSLQQVLLAPVPKTRASEYQQEQERIGLRDKNRNLVNSAGLKRNTQDWFIETLLPTLNAAGYSEPAQITEEIQRLLPRQTVDRLAGAGLMDRALIKKEVDRNRAQQAAGDAPLAALLATSPGTQIKGFSEGLKALEAVTTDAAMGPSIDVLGRLTKSFQNMTDYVKAHPDDVKMFAHDIDMLVRILLGVASVAGKVLDILPAPLRKAATGAIAGGIAGTVIPGAGTVAGAAVGGGLGLLDGFTLAPPKGWHSTMGGLSMAPDAATIQKQSYTSPAGGLHTQPISLTVNLTSNLDGRVIAENTTRHQTAWAMRPSAAGNAPDYMEVAPRPGVPLVST